MRNTFHVIRKRNHLSATFNNYKAAYGAEAIVTLDEALIAIERKALWLKAKKARQMYHPPTRTQLFAIANLHARQAGQRGKVKMPQLSILREELNGA